MPLSSWPLPALETPAAAHWRAEVPHVARLVTARLARSPYLPIRRLVCHYDQGTLTLGGRVPTFYLRQLAWALVADLDDVIARIDKIEVVPPGSRTQHK
jgi:hypothetical protein